MAHGRSSGHSEAVQSELCISVPFAVDCLILPVAVAYAMKLLEFAMIQ